MADDKKKSDSWDFDPIEATFVLIFLLAFLGALASAILNYIASGDISFFGYKLSNIVEFFRSHALFFKILGYTVAGATAIGTFVYTKKADAIWREEKAKLYPDPSDMKVFSAIGEPAKNPMLTRWQNIVEQSQSQNISDWRIAIIEADIILDELLQKLELPGDTMGEKLQAVEKSDFTTIENAWEAHKFRNSIAHQGENFVVNQREVAHIVSLYESVFKEFYLI